MLWCVPGQGSLVGTLIYMSPEVLEGSVNLRSNKWMIQGDVYALGLLLWEIWTCCSTLYTGSCSLSALPSTLVAALSLCSTLYTGSCSLSALLSTLVAALSCWLVCLWCEIPVSLCHLVFDCGLLVLLP